jgi:hypothetical protein
MAWAYPRQNIDDNDSLFCLTFFILTVSSCFACLSLFSSKLLFGEQEFNVDWQRAAAGLLVAIGSHDPDLVCHFSTISPIVSGHNY